MADKVDVVIKVPYKIFTNILSSTTGISNKFSFRHFILHMRASEVNGKQNQRVAQDIDRVWKEKETFQNVVPQAWGNANVFMIPRARDWTLTLGSPGHPCWPGPLRCLAVTILCPGQFPIMGKQGGLSILILYTNSALSLIQKNFQIA